MSGRKGLGVKADDLLNRLEENALRKSRNAILIYPSDEKLKTARVIAVGALRYFLLKFTRNTVIVFDFKEALSFEGETGCFCQYSAVRANSIFRKLEANRIRNFNIQDSGIRKNFKIFSAEDGNEVWSMVILLRVSKKHRQRRKSPTNRQFLAKYTFNLAKAFNLFYHNHRIIAEENSTKRRVLIAVADLARRNLTAALDCLGIEVPERM
jgi:arginyl-tRNA synthetase